MRKYPDVIAECGTCGFQASGTSEEVESEVAKHRDSKCAAWFYYSHHQSDGCYFALD